MNKHRKSTKSCDLKQEYMLQSWGQEVFSKWPRSEIHNCRDGASAIVHW